MTAPVVAVRPASFTKAANDFEAVQNGIRAAIDTLTSGLQNTTSMAGSDSTGREFAATYDPFVNGDKSLLAGAALLGNAAGKMAELLDASAINHLNANQAYGLCSPTNPSGDPRALGTIPVMSVGSSFGGPGEPSNWEKLKEFIEGEVFPDGDPGKLQKAGDAWTAAATAIRSQRADVESAIAGITQERSAEVAPAKDQADLIATHLNELADSFDGAATLCNSYAGHVKEVREKTADEVRDLTCELVGTFILGAVLTLVTAGLSNVLSTAAGVARATVVGGRIASLIKTFGVLAEKVLRPASYLLDPVGAAAGDLGALMGARATVFGMNLTKGAVRAEQLANAVARLPDWAGKELERAADPAKLHQALIDSGAPRSLADEAAANSPYRNMTPDQIVDKYWDAEKGQWKYPPNNGFDGSPTVDDKLPSDVKFDRFGGEGGGYLGRDGDSYTDRALAPGNANAYHQYVGTGEPLPSNLEVRYGPIAGAFDQGGGGTQWAVFVKGGDEPVSISDLIDKYDVLERVK